MTLVPAHRVSEMAPDVLGDRAGPPPHTPLVKSQSITVTHDQRVEALRAQMARPGAAKIGPARPVRSRSGSSSNGTPGLDDRIAVLRAELARLEKLRDETRPF